MKRCMGYLLGVFILFAVSAVPQVVDASVLHEVKAVKKGVKSAVEQVRQRKRQIGDVSSRWRAKSRAKTKTFNPITGEWGTQMTCTGGNIGTCQNSVDDFPNCMNQTRNYYYRLVAAYLEAKLNGGKKLSDEDRKDLELDVASVKEAINTGTVVDPDPKDPQRWFGWLNKNDQMEINRLNSKYTQEVHDDCDARFGGMSQY